MRIYLQTQPSPEQPLRFYQLQLQQDLLGGWNLIRESGIQGMRGSVSKEYFSDREEAEQMLMKRRDGQLRRGYHIVFREGVVG
ncbi:MAG: WGR domain-containing protein [Sedimenticola sp.]